MTRNDVPAKIAGFSHVRAGHCGSGALRDLFEHRGLDYGRGRLSEGALFGMGGGLGFFYAEIAGIVPPFYLVGRTGDLESDIAKHTDATVELRETDDPATGWRWVAEEIDDGRPAVVWADIAHLEYLRVRMSNTRHTIVIVGYDEQEGVAWIADNDREDLQRCSLESLAAARASHGFPAPTNHRTFVYRWPKSLPDPALVLDRSLRRSIQNMKDPAPSVGGLEGATGLDGVQAFSDRYRAWPETFGDDLETALAGLSVFIAKAGTGGAFFRSLHAEYLHDFAELLDRPRLGIAARVYGDLADAWRELGIAARAGDHAAGLPVLDRVVRLEHEGVMAMKLAL